MALFCLNFCRTLVLLVGPLVPLFWTSGDVCPGVQSSGGSPRLHAMSPCSITSNFRQNLAFHIENEPCCIKHYLCVYEQKSIVNGVCVDDWTAE